MGFRIEDSVPGAMRRATLAHRFQYLHYVRLKWLTTSSGVGTPECREATRDGGEARAEQCVHGIKGGPVGTTLLG